VNEAENEAESVLVAAQIRHTLISNCKLKQAGKRRISYARNIEESAVQTTYVKQFPAI
jgi:hypothetical protein